MLITMFKLASGLRLHHDRNDLSLGAEGRTHEAALAFPNEGEPPSPDLYAGGRVSCVVKALTGSVTGRGESYEVIAKAARYSPIRAYYDPDTEAKAWNKLLDFFARHVRPNA